MKRNHKTHKMFSLYRGTSKDDQHPVFISSYFTIEALRLDAIRFAEDILGGRLDYMTTIQDTPSRYHIRFGAPTVFIIVEELKDFFYEGVDDEA